MLFKSFFAAALASQAIATPILESRATSDSSAFAALQRAANLSSAAYTGCSGSAFDITITKQINDNASDTQGYIGYSKSEKKISVVMRGSTTLIDIENDIDLVMVTPTLSGVSFPTGVKIMHGIYSPWSAVHQTVISEVKSLIEKYPSYSLESTGHSLGGSLTYISYIALVQNFPSKNVTSNAMAAFPIGNSVFAKWAGSLNGTLNRGNNADDGVPNLWTSAPFSLVHYGTEYYSSGTAASTIKCSGERDSQCSAGNGLLSVSAGHFYSFGVELGFVGCK
ncbi:hypothetical protein N7495_008650 [Penicillium taxi]|uniref:uncharacterized protein n=1 Tax=Penicillium taxi TaxID=168475 RepID=UPI0025456702|nr:uncharacterized protein N7495_008650 [Penicillium taxi]KAJ5888609.1 hypothetical protein N7495_008650 [Penicillium taxi]